MSVECLQNAIGLSRNDCECFEDGRPADYNESESGLYLDELEGLELKVQDYISDCGEGGLWVRMQRALDNACLQFTTDLNMCLSRRATLAKSEFNGNLGEKSFTTGLTGLKNYNGMKIDPECHEVEGGCMIIRGVNAYFKDTGTLTLEIYDNLGGPAITIANFNTLANQPVHTSFTTPIELPLFDANNEQLKYWVVYNWTGGDPQPCNNKLTCGCKGKNYNWEQWVDINGVRLDDAQTKAGEESNSFTHGLLLDISFVCKISDIVCPRGVINWETDPLARVIAYAIRYKAGDLLLQDLLSSQKVGQFTILNAEHAPVMINEYRSQYERRVAEICERVDFSNDCWICSDDRLMQGDLMI